MNVSKEFKVIKETTVNITLTQREAEVLLLFLGKSSWIKSHEDYRKLVTEGEHSDVIPRLYRDLRSCGVKYLHEGY